MIGQVYSFSLKNRSMSQNSFVVNLCGLDNVLIIGLDLDLQSYSRLYLDFCLGVSLLMQISVFQYELV